MAIQTITIDTEQWAVVPKEATDRMRDAVGPEHPHARYIYRAMVAAAPRPEAGQPAENTSEAIGYISQQGLDWLKSDGYRAATLRSQPSSDNTIPLYTEQQPVPRPVPASDFERGALTAIALIIRCHDSESLAFDILNEMGLNGADCSELDECDKKDLSQLIGYRGAKLRGLVRPAEPDGGAV